MATFVQWHFQPAEPGDPHGSSTHGSHTGHSSTHTGHSSTHGSHGASANHLEALKAKIRDDLGTKNYQKPKKKGKNGKLENYKFIDKLENTKQTILGEKKINSITLNSNVDFFWFINILFPAKPTSRSLNSFFKDNTLAWNQAILNELFYTTNTDPNWTGRRSFIKLRRNALQNIANKFKARKMKWEDLIQMATEYDNGKWGIINGIDKHGKTIISTSLAVHLASVHNWKHLETWSAYSKENSDNVIFRLMAYQPNHNMGNGYWLPGDNTHKMYNYVKETYKTSDEIFPGAFSTRGEMESGRHKTFLSRWPYNRTVLKISDGPNKVLPPDKIKAILEKKSVGPKILETDPEWDEIYVNNGTIASSEGPQLKFDFRFKLAMYFMYSVLNYIRKATIEKPL